MINTWWFGSTSSATFYANFDGIPANPIGHGASRCGEGTVILHATVLPIQTVDWYATAMGGTPLLAGDTTFVTPVINATTTYYAEARNDSSNCLSASRTPVTATILPAPVPTITGPDSVCTGSSDNFYTTEPGMTNYIWNVSSGGAITYGSGTNVITVIWNITGDQTVSVNYTDATGCTASPPAIYNVNVNPLPVPTITGPVSACITSPGNTYKTEAGMTGYVWTISAGGTITNGSGTNTITVTWNTTGAQSVSVNYTDTNGCTAYTPTVYEIMVNPLPVPTISGPDSICTGSSGNIYKTESGMTGYVWTVSSGGTITNGTATNTLTITWNTAGAQIISVNYTDTNGCAALTPTVYEITVNPLPVPTISGPDSTCAGSTGNIYTTESGMTDYVWIVSAGGTIINGTGTNAITITWNTTGTQIVSINYTDANGCSAITPATYDVMVNPLPDPAGMINGMTPVCAGTSGVVYGIAPVSNTLTYSWTLSPGATIAAGEGTNNITVDFSANATSGNFTVFTSNLCGNGLLSPPFPVMVNQSPVVSAGEDLSTCESLPVTLSASAATNYVSLLWTTSGTGTFNDPAILHPEYTPGAMDVSNGFVTLTLIAFAEEPCQ
jgi:hypothetical protein